PRLFPTAQHGQPSCNSSRRPRLPHRSLMLMKQQILVPSCPFLLVSRSSQYPAEYHQGIRRWLTKPRRLSRMKTLLGVDHLAEQPFRGIEDPSNPQSSWERQLHRCYLQRKARHSKHKPIPPQGLSDYLGWSPNLMDDIPLPIPET